MDKKEKLQEMLDKIDSKTGTASVKSARQERIEKLVKEMADDADIKEELVRTRLTFRKYLTEFAQKIGSLDGIVDAIKRNKVEIPQQLNVKVTNTGDMPKPVFNVPSLFDIRKPTWIDTITAPIKAVNSKMDQVLQAIKNVKMSEDPEKPIAVRLSDGKKFYEAITQVFGGTAGNVINIPKVSLSGGQQAIPVVNPDGTNISGGGGGGAGDASAANQDEQTALLTTIDADTGNISTKIDTVAGAVSGSEMQVDIVSAPPLTVNSHDVTNAGTFLVQAQQSGTWDEVGINDSGNSITVDGTVTANLSATDNAVLDNIDTSTAGILADTAAIQTAVETIDNAISGSEMQVDVIAALPAGTNAIGKLAANSGVDIGDVDITSIAAGDNNIGNVDIASIAAGTNAIGKLLPPDVDVTTHTNYAKKYYTNAGAVTDGIVWSPAAGKRFHVVSMYLQISAAATITLEDDKAGGDEAIWKGEFAANQGMTINFSEKYPLASGEDAADLIVTTTAGNIYCTITGYEI